MVQLKYFGDMRDYFKYDLISAILKSSDFQRYVFIPMLTTKREDDEGKKPPRNPDETKSKELQSFILSKMHEKSLCHWKELLEPLVNMYLTIEPADEIFFSDNNRTEYWNLFYPLLKEKNALIFLDPDTGIETGSKRYRSKVGPEKYILNSEMIALMEIMDNSSLLMIYQHLPRNKKVHDEQVKKKMLQIKSLNSKVFISAYREDDLAFIFVSKEIVIHDKNIEVIDGYDSASGSKYKSKHNFM